MSGKALAAGDFQLDRRLAPCRSRVLFNRTGGEPEKAIKAVFLKHGQSFPFTHDLHKLLRLLEQNGLRVPQYVHESTELTQYAHVTRYPGMADPVTRREAARFASPRQSCVGPSDRWQPPRRNGKAKSNGPASEISDTAEAAAEYGRIFMELRRTGRPRQQIDIQIGAIARTLPNCIIVSKDSDLSAILNVTIENWAT